MFGLKANTGVGLVLALALSVRVQAHIALWDEGMYGFDPNDPNQQEPILPLEKLPFSQWWFHNYINRPPQPGKRMQLPAGGTYHGQVACNKAFTRYGQNDYQQTGEYACDDDKPTSGTGAMHTTDKMGSSNPTDVKGCGLAIAYESDVSKLKPEDFTVISIAYDCPWKKNVDFPIPADLPACPEGGCHCSWGWVHSVDGGSPQMYHLGYRCDVTGAVATRALPDPLVSRKCDFPNDVSNCTVGGKQPHYWLQAERNNNFQGEHDPPYYNHEMGFMNGAQTDLFAAIGDAPATASAASLAEVPSQVVEPSSSIASSVQDTPSSAADTTSASISSVSPSPNVPSPTLSLSAVASSISIMGNVSAVESTSATVVSITSTATPSETATSAVPSSFAAPAPAAAASGKICKRRKRRSLDTRSDNGVGRHHARNVRSRNRTIGVRHTMVAPQF